MNKLRSRLLLTGLLVIATLVITINCRFEENEYRKGDFDLYLYTGSEEIGAEVMNFEDFIANEYRPVVLNFWAGACPPCRAEMPILENAWREYSDEVMFIGVDIGPYVGLGNYFQGKALVNEFGITYVTGNTGNMQVVTDWQLASMPSTFFIEPNGHIHNFVIGSISSTRLSKKIQELIITSNE